MTRWNNINWLHDFVRVYIDIDGRTCTTSCFAVDSISATDNPISSDGLYCNTTCMYFMLNNVMTCVPCDICPPTHRFRVRRGNRYECVANCPDGYNFLFDNPYRICRQTCDGPLVGYTIIIGGLYQEH